MPFLDLKIQKRLKGVAGSGKSLVAGARACTLAIRDDKKVLLLCYNITMKKYLKEIVYSYQQNYYPKQH